MTLNRVYLTALLGQVGPITESTAGLLVITVKDRITGQEGNNGHNDTNNGHNALKTRSGRRLSWPSGINDKGSPEQGINDPSSRNGPVTGDIGCVLRGTDQRVLLGQGNGPGDMPGACVQWCSQE